jgi:Uma2 family endonuclease
MTAQPIRRRFTVHDYYRMAKAGILHEDDRVELIEGEIIEMPPIGSHHSSIVDRLVWLLHQKVDLRERLIRVQEPVRLSAESEPLPDIVIVPFREDFYRQRHPRPDEVLLIIEVADSSLAYEHQIKIPLYGRSGVPEVWVVDANGRAVDVFRQPEADGYSEHHRVVDSAASLTPAKLRTLTLQLEDILGAS